MKIHCVNPSCVFGALIVVMKMFRAEPEEVQVVDEADLVFVINDRKLLFDNYKKDRLFAFWSPEPQVGLPENVVFLSFDMEENYAAFERVKKELVKPKEAKKEPVRRDLSIPGDLVVTEKSYDVLIIDDTTENLAFAEVLLGKHHRIVLTHGFAEGMQMLIEQKFDAVLSDMKMPANKHYPSLSYGSMPLGTTLDYGFFVIFEATAKGIPVAVVTDGDHHNDWVSAGFDHLKEAVVNGQRVLFFNRIGKRWDKALYSLMEKG